MRRLIPRMILGTLLCSIALAVGLASADDKPRLKEYAVTITNLARGQSFTPILVASHKRGVTLFTAGSPASQELALLAESGDTGPLSELLKDSKKVKSVETSEGLLDPRQSTTVSVKAGGRFRHISTAAMLIPTNDAFFAIQGVRIPLGLDARVVFSPGYDAGSEPNDELCFSIPDPVCGGEGPSPDQDGEGYVHIHAGIHEIGDLEEEDRDWRNPVARITIRRIK